MVPEPQVWTTLQYRIFDYFTVSQANCLLQIVTFFSMRLASPRNGPASVVLRVTYSCTLFSTKQYTACVPHKFYDHYYYVRVCTLYVRVQYNVYPYNLKLSCCVKHSIPLLAHQEIRIVSIIHCMRQAWPQGRSVTQWVWGAPKNIIDSTRGVNRAGPNAGRAGPGRVFKLRTGPGRA